MTTGAGRHTAGILRHQARDAAVFDHSNDTVVVTRTMLVQAADEIDRELQA